MVSSFYIVATEQNHGRAGGSGCSFVGIETYFLIAAFQIQPMRSPARKMPSPITGARKVMLTQMSRKTHQSGKSAIQLRICFTDEISGFGCCGGGSCFPAAGGVAGVGGISGNIAVVSVVVSDGQSHWFASSGSASAEVSPMPS